MEKGGGAGVKTLDIKVSVRPTRVDLRCGQFGQDPLHCLCLIHSLCVSPDSLDRQSEVRGNAC